MAKTRKLRSWSSADMANAIDAVRRKELGLKKASKIYKVPRTTLQRLAKAQYGTPLEAAKTKVGRPTVLSRELEEELVQYCLAMEASFFGLTRADLRRMALQLAERNNIRHPFSHEMAGKKWVKLFLKRHNKKLSERKPTGTSYSRALGFSKDNTEKFFKLLEDVYEKGKYTADRIYNVDETGISIVQSKVAKVIGLRGKRQIVALTSAERGALITIVVCMNAAGSFVPPLVIFPRKNMNIQLQRGAPPGTIFAAHPSGWMQTNIFTKCFQHFIEFVKPTEDKPVLLILDGHYSHTQNIDLIDLARENHITVVSLRPYSSHHLQPLDRTFMGPLKTYYSEEIRQWLRQNDRPVSAFEVMELFGRAYIKCQTAEISINGFRVTGIYPMDKNKFTDVEYIEEVNNMQTLPGNHSQQEVRGQGNEENKENNEESNATDRVIDLGVDISKPPTPKVSQVAEPSTSDGKHHKVATALDLIPLHNRPGTSGLSKTQGLPRNDYKGFPTSPFQIAPIPKVKKRTSTRGRKACSSAVITSSPYKTELEQAIEARSESKESVQSRGRGRGGKSLLRPAQQNAKRETVKKRLKIAEQDSTSEDTSSEVSSGSSEPELSMGTSPPHDDDAECIFCNLKFSQDTRGELWVMCMKCSLWAHVDCAGADRDAYICDFCATSN